MGRESGILREVGVYFGGRCLRVCLIARLPPKELNERGCVEAKGSGCTGGDCGELFASSKHGRYAGARLGGWVEGLSRVLDIIT